MNSNYNPDEIKHPLHSNLLELFNNSFDCIFEINYNINLLFSCKIIDGELIKTQKPKSLSQYLYETESFLCHPDDRELFHNTFSFESVYKGIKNESHNICIHLRILNNLREYQWWVIMAESFFSAETGISMLIFARSMKKPAQFQPESSSIIKSISSIYSTTIYIDFYAGTYTAIESSVQLPFFHANGIYRTFIEEYASHCVCEEHRKIFLDFFDEENLITQLTSTSTFAEIELRRVIDGKSGWMRFVVIPAGTEHPIRYAILACNDITAQKEEELINQQALKDAFAAANRANQAKTEFLNNMSHDIRTPMNAILGMVLLAGTHINDNSYVLDCLNKINIAGKHLLSLINDILDMSKIESGRAILSKEEFCLGDAINDVMNIISPEIKKKSFNLTCNTSGIENDIVIGDKLRFKQILINLLSNSCKYTNEYGTITFSASKNTLHSVVSYEFTISDTGIGIPEDYFTDLFQPFSRNIDNETVMIEGSGLGLAITYNLIILMNGTITVNSKVGKGTSFIITIPFIPVNESIQPASHHKPENIINSSSSHSGFQRRFLLVDDNEMNLEVEKELIQLNNAVVETAGNGREAVTAFISHPKDYYDAIFMDIRMPVMNGYDAASQIRQHPELNGDTIPIIAMTANAFSEDILTAKKYGMTDHLSKPIDISSLHRIINSL